MEDSERVKTDEVLLTTADVLKIMGISRQHLSELMNLGQFPEPIKLSHHTFRWRRQNISAFLAAKTSASPAVSLPARSETVSARRSREWREKRRLIRESAQSDRL